MDRSDNPGDVEREMDETPVQRENVSDRGMGTDRDAMQGGGSVEREGVQRTGGTERESTGGGSVEREGMQASSVDGDVMEGRGNDGMMPTTSVDGGVSDQMLRADQREGGPGYDRPVETTPARDMDPAGRSSGGDRMHGSPTDARSGRSIGDQGRKTTGEGISRDW